MSELPVRFVVVMPPRVDKRRVLSGGHDVDRRKAVTDHLGWAGANVSDTLSQCPNVDLPMGLTKEPHRAAGGAEIGGGNLEHRGLASAVRPEHHPPFVAVDMPVDVVEQHPALPHN